MKRILTSLFWSFMILLLLYLGVVLQARFKEYQEMDFNPKPYIIFTVAYPILMGMVIRLPQLITGIMKKKRWCVDWIKLCVIGLPSLYIAISPLSFFINIPIFNLNLVNNMFSAGITVMTVAGVISGYIILDSIKEK
jgi:hypothetical protein